MPATPRLTLAALDPEAVAAEAVRRVEDHLQSLAHHLGPSVQFRLEGARGPGGLATTAAALVRYAQSGLPVLDWTDTGMVSDGLLSVLTALYTCAGEPSVGGGPIDALDDVDPDEPLGLALLGAWARMRLDMGEALTVRELGVLAGLGSHGVRTYVRSGELAVGDGRPARVAAEDARRWLGARGVRGRR